MPGGIGAVARPAFGAAVSRSSVGPFSIGGVGRSTRQSLYGRPNRDIHRVEWACPLAQRKTVRLHRGPRGVAQGGRRQAADDRPREALPLARRHVWPDATKLKSDGFNPAGIEGGEAETESDFKPKCGCITYNPLEKGPA